MPFCAAASKIEVPGGQLIFLSSMVKIMFSKRLTPFNPKWNNGIMESWNNGVSGFQSDLKWLFPNLYPLFQSSNIPIFRFVEPINKQIRPETIEFI
jgi:hypothetical protein